MIHATKKGLKSICGESASNQCRLLLIGSNFARSEAVFIGVECPTCLKKLSIRSKPWSPIWASKKTTIRRTIDDDLLPKLSVPCAPVF